MENKPNVSKVNMDSIPPELREKLTPRKKEEQVFKGTQNTPEKKTFQSRETPKSEKPPVEKKTELTEKEAIKEIIRLSTKHLSKSKAKTIADIIDQSEDFASQLGIKFTDDDIELLFFKGDVTKEIDIFKNGRFFAEMKTLTLGEREEAVRIYSEYIKKDDSLVHTNEGFNRFKTKCLVAQSIVSVNGEPAPATLLEKINYLSSLNDWVYEHLVSRFNLLTLAVNEVITANVDDTVKKY